MGRPAGRWTRSRSIALAAWVAASCSGGTTVPDAGPGADAGLPADAGASVDAGLPFDAGAVPDAGLLPDAGPGACLGPVSGETEPNDGWDAATPHLPGAVVTACASPSDRDVYLVRSSDFPTGSTVTVRYTNVGPGSFNTAVYNTWDGGFVAGRFVTGPFADAGLAFVAPGRATYLLSVTNGTAASPGFLYTFDVSWVDQSNPCAAGMTSLPTCNGLPGCVWHGCYTWPDGGSGGCFRSLAAGGPPACTVCPGYAGYGCPPYDAGPGTCYGPVAGESEPNETWDAATPHLPGTAVTACAMPGERDVYRIKASDFPTGSTVTVRLANVGPGLFGAAVHDALDGGWVAGRSVTGPLAGADLTFPAPGRGRYYLTASNGVTLPPGCLYSFGVSWVEAPNPCGAGMTDFATCVATTGCAWHACYAWPDGGLGGCFQTTASGGPPGCVVCPGYAGYGCPPPGD